MPDSTRLDQFRLALSYLERIEGEKAHWDKLRSGQIQDRSTYDNVRATYADHVRRATDGRPGTATCCRRRGAR